MKSIQKLREQRAEAAKNIRKLMDETEGQEWSAENDADYKKLVAVLDSTEEEIGRVQKVLDVEAASQQSIESIAERKNISVDEAANDLEFKNELFNAWARGGKGNLTEEQLEYVREQNLKAGNIQNAQSVGTDTEGGFTAHTEFGGQLFKALKAFGGVRSVASVRSTSTGNPIVWPKTNTTAQEGALVAENANVGSGSDVVFGQVQIGAYKYSSLPIAISMELMRDSLVDIEAEIRDVLVERLARVTNRHYTVGSGSNQPTGIVTASALGHTAAAAGAITFNELVELEHSVDPAYRAAGQCGFMFHDQTLKALKQIQDADGRPIWMPGYANKEGDRLLGYSYTINQNMDVMGADNKPVLFGRMNDYMVRDVTSVELFRMTDSKYLENGQVGFLAFVRTDGQFIGADNGSIHHLANAAS